MKQWKNLSEKDYLVSIKSTEDKPTGVAVEKITLYTDENVGGFKAKIVEELPEKGESGIMYLILKEQTEEGNIFNEYMWVEEGGVSKFEHIGATDKVDVILYNTTGQHTDGAMTQKATTDALAGKADSSSLSPVATSGDYNDLSNKPSIPTPVNVEQTTGTSTTNVMSQNATTGLVFADPVNRNKIAIGKNVTTSSYSTNKEIVIGDGAKSNGSGSIAIGVNSKADSSSSIALGYATANGGSSIAMGSSAVTQMGANNSLAILWEAYAGDDGALAIGGQSYADYKYSIALGHGARTSAKGEMNIGANGNYGYNNSQYRLLTGLYDPQSAHDAATKGYVDMAAPAFTNAEFNSIFNTNLTEES